MHSELDAGLRRRIADKWSLSRYGFHAPATPAEIQELEERTGLRLPPSLAYCLGVANGMPERKSDDVHLRWCGTRDISVWSQYLQCSPDLRGVLIFADFLLESLYYGLVIEGREVWPTGSVLMGHNCEPRVSNPTFEDFLRMYLDEPGRIGR